jgi:hypothetical protein
MKALSNHFLQRALVAEEHEYCVRRKGKAEEAVKAAEQALGTQEFPRNGLG